MEPTTMQTRVLYDGTCPLCQRGVRQLRSLDWCRRLEFIDARHPELFPPDMPALDPAQLMEQMHVVTPGGKVLAGFRGIRYLAWLLPLGWPFVLFLYLPGVPILGQWLYLKVARNRYNLVPCQDGVCSLPPQSTQPRTLPQGTASPNPRQVP
jgi:predicted DCC family thiol-disulfide oxidoreductase YuxK